VGRIGLLPAGPRHLQSRGPADGLLTTKRLVPSHRRRPSNPPGRGVIRRAIASIGLWAWGPPVVDGNVMLFFPLTVPPGQFADPNPPPSLLDARGIHPT